MNLETFWTIRYREWKNNNNNGKKSGVNNPPNQDS